MNTITVLTDFGTKDPYVGVMKGVMLAINPQLSIVDVTHEVEPQDVEEASFLIREYYPYFPRGTVHLCVVDPTVGGSRKALVVLADGHFFVGPDNGIFSLLFAKGKKGMHEITNSRFMARRVSGTFHGRDIFAPAAAYLSLGTPLAEFGPAFAEGIMLRVSSHGRDDVMEGKIVRFDPVRKRHLQHLLRCNQ
jgi:S-adenosylmethionine hydrolase